MRGDSIIGLIPYFAGEFGQSWRRIVGRVLLQSPCSAWRGQLLEHKLNGAFIAPRRMATTCAFPSPRENCKPDFAFFAGSHDGPRNASDKHPPQGE
eukprot:778722-Pyramimonas_sp.AAC.1